MHLVTSWGQAAAQLDGLDGGRAVTKDNLTQWWSSKVKAHEMEVDSSARAASGHETSAEKVGMHVNPVAPAQAHTKPASQAAPKPAVVKELKDSLAVPSSAEKEARIGLLGEELTTLARVKLSGDAIPSLRPSPAEIMQEFDLDAMRAEESVTLGMKTRQIMGRFLEGSARSSKEVAALLLGSAANKPSEDEEAECMVKIEESISTIAELVDRRPKISDGRVEGDGAVKRWKVKDVADIPERFRALVDAHRMMEVAVCDRIKVIATLMTNLSGSKSTAKLDKSLLVLKDKYLKLEEKEKKERDKLEGKLETDRKKQQQRDDKDKEKERKKAEEKPKETKSKEAKAAMESKEGGGKTSEKAHKPANKSKKPEPVKNSGASSIMSFFGKPAGVAQPKVAAAEQVSEGVEKSAMAVAQAAAPKSAQKELRNFHPWEKPKNALVAPFPYGPGAQHERASQSPASTDLASWLAVLRSETVRTARTRPLREDGTPHPKMKLIQLNMKIPLVKTQLVDVDVEAEKKVFVLVICAIFCSIASLSCTLRSLCVAHLAGCPVYLMLPCAGVLVHTRRGFETTSVVATLWNQPHVHAICTDLLGRGVGRGRRQIE